MTYLDSIARTKIGGEQYSVHSQYSACYEVQSSDDGTIWSFQNVTAQATLVPGGNCDLVVCQEYGDLINNFTSGRIRRAGEFYQI